MEIIKGLYYTKDHEWLKVEEGKAYIGITDYAQKALGEIVFVELPEIDDEFEKGEAFGVIESVKAASDIYMPVSGKVLEINEELEDSPELVNEDPYGSWIICIKMSDESELEGLMDEKEYEVFCSEEEK
ncbi:MAG: glycine cleavage system protein GcvH [Thermoanaerobacterales bacterium]|jgi:glycine cleavage system H protein|nr:glycine cleavage system protein GcvH [Thermoanaerobacterales bacterium]